MTVIERVNGAAVLEAYANLAFRDADESNGIQSQMLERFIRLGTTLSDAAKLNHLGDDPGQEPVVLLSGTLAELLQAGILPDEAWIFVLNHGGARPATALILDPKDPGKDTVRSHDVSLKPDVQRRRIQKTIDSCCRAAKALRKVQLMDMTGALVALGSVREIEPAAPTDLSSDKKTAIVRGTNVARFGPHPVSSHLLKPRR